MKMYFSPRNRHVSKHPHPPPSSSSSSSSSHQYPGWANNNYNSNNNFPRTTFRSKLGNASHEDTTTKSSRINNSSSDRYSRKYPMLHTLLDPNYGGYSTLVKLPVNYISLGGGEDATRFSHGANASETTVGDNSTPQPHGAVSDYQQDDNNDHAAAGSISESPISYHPRPPQRPHRPPHRPRWISLSLGDSELVNDIQSNPFNQHPLRDSDLRLLRRPPPTISNIMRGVKHKLARPPQGYPPPHRYPPPHHGQYDSSKYPPNVVVLNSKSEKAPHNYSVPVGGELDGGDRSNLVSGDTIAHNNGQKLSPTSSFSLGQGGGSYRPGQVVHVTNRVPNRTRMPHTLPPFMNSLMDSVANFFGNVG